MDVDVTHGEGRKAFEQAVQTADLLMVTTDNRQSVSWPAERRALPAPKWWLAPCSEPALGATRTSTTPRPPVAPECFFGPKRARHG